MGPRLRSIHITLPLLLLVAIGLAACSNGSRKETSGTASGAFSADSAGATGAQAARVGASTPNPAAPSGDPGSRSVVSTASVTIRLADVRDGIDRVAAIGIDAGGFVQSQQASLDGDRSATVTLKVPPPRFDAVVEALGRLGTLVSRQVGREDVTGQVFDLDGRLKTAQASTDRLRALLGDARTTTDIVAVESELTQRETTLEQLLGARRVLTERIDLATVTVLLSPKAKTPDKGIPGVGKGLKGGATALVVAAKVVALVVAAVLPFAPVVLIAWFVVRALVRRRRRRGLSPQT